MHCLFMKTALQIQTKAKFLIQSSSIRMFSGEKGSGAGKGGGAGGSVREAGGSLGKFAAANEEGYFFEKQRRQLRKLREKLKKNSPNVAQKPEE